MENDKEAIGESLQSGTFGPLDRFWSNRCSIGRYAPMLSVSLIAGMRADTFASGPGSRSADRNVRHADVERGELLLLLLLLLLVVVEIYSELSAETLQC